MLHWVSDPLHTACISLKDVVTEWIWTQKSFFLSFCTLEETFRDSCKCVDFTDSVTVFFHLHSFWKLLQWTGPLWQEKKTKTKNKQKKRCNWAKKVFTHIRKGLLDTLSLFPSPPTGTTLWNEAIPFWKNSFVQAQKPPPQSEQLWFLFDLLMFSWKHQTLQIEQAVSQA